MLLRVRGAGLPLALLLTSASLANRAGAAPTDGPRWGCWYQPAESVLACILVRRPEGDRAQVETRIAARIDRRLPGHLATLWGAPETFGGKRFIIPLWNVPYDMQDAARLADSVMCGLRDDCTVYFDDNPDDRAHERAIAIRSGAAERDVMAEVVALAAGKPAAPDSVLLSASSKGKRRSAALR
jgi:hypothetical protein